ncbi:MAG: UDP-glucose/GDP-mannose dehydrogenase family protein [Deferribacteraceae bacterium]|jgi:UDPglucose 6-dehydrogenase|nr:UDP-glucose/GDP-mannose dehydrogenase family protein [Deferribacteraceae bacterium]
MNIAVIGTGYVGLPTGVGFAELGNNVICIDKLSAKIDMLNSGKITIFEEGLEDLYHKNRSEGVLKFSSDIGDIEWADVVIIAVGTPTHPVTKEADLKYLYQAAEDIAPHLKKYTVVAIKSTVPVSTGESVEKLIAKMNPSADFDLVSLPEFLREGFAVYDFFNPDRIVIGTDSERAVLILKRLYEPFEGKTKILVTARNSAEVIKYASNAFLAMKVLYINEISNFCEKCGARIEEVALGIGLDSRIGPKFLKPGPGYGGSCFPKDTLALANMAKRCNVNLHLTDTAIEKNEQRKIDMAHRIAELVPDGATVAVLGLTYKSGTDDVRESPAVDICRELLRLGVALRAYDPKGMNNAREQLKDAVYYAKNPYDAAGGADILAILTEWSEFAKLNFRRVKAAMRQAKIIDLRNLLARDQVEGFEYHRLGEGCLESEKMREQIAPIN